MIDELNEIDDGRDEPAISIELDGDGKEGEILSVELSPTNADNHLIVTLRMGIGAMDAVVTHIRIDDLDRLGHFLSRIARRWKA